MSPTIIRYDYFSLYRNLNILNKPISHKICMLLRFGNYNTNLQVTLTYANKSSDSTLFQNDDFES